MNPEEKKLTASEIKLTSNLPNELDKDDPQENKNIEVGNEKNILPNLIQFNAKDIVPNLGDKEFNLKASRETTRSQLATFLIGILSKTIIASFSLAVILLIMSIFIDEKKASSFDKTSALVKDLITLILTAQIGLVGTALGFYFGSKENSD